MYIYIHSRQAVSHDSWAPGPNCPEPNCRQLGSTLVFIIEMMYNDFHFLYTAGQAERDNLRGEQKDEEASHNLYTKSN